MSDSASEASVPTVEEGSAAASASPCAELKVAMEKCAAEKGEDNCLELINAYKECIKSLGPQN